MSASRPQPHARRGRAAPVLELADDHQDLSGRAGARRRLARRSRRGTVHALLGENGAGKSTLIKIISGVERPDSGTYRLFGRPADIRNPRQAMQTGISVVHQERNLVPTFTVGENVLLDRIVGDGRSPGRPAAGSMPTRCPSWRWSG